MAFAATVATPDAMGTALAGDGITYVASSAVSNGADVRAFGTYSGLMSGTKPFLAANFGITESIITNGAIISTGRVIDSVVSGGSPQSASKSTDFGTVGVVGDDIILTFSFIPAHPLVIWPIVFGSEEYNEFVDLSFNDTMSVLIDGVEAAYLPGSAIKVAINNVNNHSHTTYFVTNTAGTVLQYDGLVPLNLILFLQPNVPHTVQVEVKDLSDGIYDSAVMMGIITAFGELCDGTDLSSFLAGYAPKATVGELAALVALAESAQTFCGANTPSGCIFSMSDTPVTPSGCISNLDLGATATVHGCISNLNG